MTVRSVLVCVRTTLAAQTVATAATRLGVTSAVRTAVSEPEVMLRLCRAASRDRARGHRPDPAGHRRLHPARAGQGARRGDRAVRRRGSACRRGRRRGRRPRADPRGDHDLVSVVAKALLLLLHAAGRPARQRGPGPPGRRRADLSGGARPGTAMAPRVPRGGPRPRGRGCAGEAGGPTAVPVQRGDDLGPYAPGDGRESTPARRGVDRRGEERFAARRPRAIERDPPDHADRAGAAGAARDGRRQEQRRDRPGAVRLRGHGQDPCPAVVPQARRPRPGARGGRRRSEPAWSLSQLAYGVPARSLGRSRRPPSGAVSSYSPRSLARVSCTPSA